MRGVARRLLVIGAGMAAGRLVSRLVAAGCGDEITLIGAEPGIAYDRVRLPDLLAGRCAEAALDLRTDWRGAARVTVIADETVARVDLSHRRALTRCGRAVDFDVLVLATGSTVPVPDIPGATLPGAGVFRTREDALRLQSIAREGGTVTIVGGGLLGLETAASFVEAGARVRVLHRRAGLMNRQLDATGSALLEAALAERGIRCLLDVQLASLEGGDRVRAVRLANGRRLSSSAVVFATGSVANDGLAVAAGLACDRGVLVDAHLRTAVAGVYALGECARVAGQRHALVAPVHAQADALAAQLLGETDAPGFVAPSPATRLKVAGIEVFSAGDAERMGSPADVCIDDPARGIHRGLWFDRSRLAAAVLVGDTRGARHIQDSIGGAPIAPADRNALAFGLDVPAGAAA